MLFTVLLSFEDPLYVPDESSAKHVVYPSQSSAFSAPSQVLLHLPLAVHVQLTDSTVALWLKSTLGSDVCTLRRCPLPPPASNQSMSVYMQGWAEIHTLSLGNTESSQSKELLRHSDPHSGRLHSFPGLPGSPPLHF